MEPNETRPPQEGAPVAAVDQEALAARKAGYRQGVMVFIGLAVLTVLEFVIAVILRGSVGLLFVVILAKAGLIVQYYMHVNRVWSEEEAH
jgi:cytochrome c oxidase subunit IV